MEGGKAKGIPKSKQKKLEREAEKSEEVGPAKEAEEFGEGWSKIFLTDLR